jgi:hypothetical protein
MKRKDMLIKDLQYKLEHNEGCKYLKLTSKFPPQKHFIFIHREHSHKKTVETNQKKKTSKTYSLCLVIVMRTTAVDEKTNEDSTSSTSCVVDSKVEKCAPVGVNNCVNINNASQVDEKFLISDQSVVENECLAAELDTNSTATTSDDLARKIEEEILNNFFNDDLTSSKYSDVTSRCEPSTSSTSAANVVDDGVVVVSSHYKSTRDNNRDHRKAVRKNFSLWIGVTSCVWGLLLLLMKNLADAD